MRKLLSLTIIAITMIVSIVQAEELDIRKPPLDKEGRFWVYRELAEDDDFDLLPFIPYGWMPKEAADMMTLSLNHESNAREKRCIAATVKKWVPPWWCGVAFISGPDNPPFWGEEDIGWYYDLSGLKKKKLVFYVRSDSNTRIQVKVGILGDKQFGDSLKLPAQTKWLKLKKEWTRYELALSKYDLSRVCNGFTFVLARNQQEEPRAPVDFFIDDIYFE